MGYRSQVVICLDKQSEEDLREIIAWMPRGTNKEEVEDFFKEATHKDDRGSIYEADWYKWYEDYPVPIFWEEFKKATSGEWGFWRVGEDTDDYEVEESIAFDNPFAIGLERKITWI